MKYHILFSTEFAIKYLAVRDNKTKFVTQGCVFIRGNRSVNSNMILKIRLNIVDTIMLNVHITSEDLLQLVCSQYSMPNYYHLFCCKFSNLKIKLLFILIILHEAFRNIQFYFYMDVSFIFLVLSVNLFRKSLFQSQYIFQNTMTLIIFISFTYNEKQSTMLGIIRWLLSYLSIIYNIKNLNGILFLMIKQRVKMHIETLIHKLLLL